VEGDTLRRRFDSALAMKYVPTAVRVTTVPPMRETMTIAWDQAVFGFLAVMNLVSAWFSGFACTSSKNLDCLRLGFGVGFRV
jgi:hypothetical protein